MLANVLSMDSTRNLISAYYRPHEFIVLQERAFVNEVLGTQLVLD